jgi:hypothetical protein
VQESGQARITDYFPPSFQNHALLANVAMVRLKIAI